ncbi:MAG: hypothetical protein MJY62_06610 [Bacteroidales bacterium]|nr:hypothetical protein [Bacteroidales bacterium]
MDRLKILALALLCLSACTKSANPGSVHDSDDLLVKVRHSESGTRSILVDGTKTRFASGDRIRVFDVNGNTAVYKFKTSKPDGDIFQMIYVKGDFKKEDFASAFYPDESLDTTVSTKTKFVANFNDSTIFVDGSFPKGAAPMTCFGKSAGGDIEFTNCFAVLAVPIRYASTPASPLKVSAITLSAASTHLNGKFEFTSSGVSAGNGSTKMTLTGCEAAGALRTTAKCFYLAVPGIEGASETMTVTVTPGADVPFSGTFEVKKSGAASVLAKNYILTLNPFVLNPVVPMGQSQSYNLAPWDNQGVIKIGQITLSSTSVSVKKGASSDIRIFGVSDWDKISTSVISGVDKFSATRKAVSSEEYYVTITGKSAGAGRLFVNDQVTNSGSYIDITVTE